jgi:hypothetical protein
MAFTSARTVQVFWLAPRTIDAEPFDILLGSVMQFPRRNLKGIRRPKVDYNYSLR